MGICSLLILVWGLLAFACLFETREDRTELLGMYIFSLIYIMLIYISMFVSGVKSIYLYLGIIPIILITIYYIFCNKEIKPLVSEDNLYTIKVKRAVAIDGNGYIIETYDRRYNNVNIKKLLPFLIKNNYTFQRGMHNNKFVSNSKYIENEIMPTINEKKPKEKQPI